uniref:Uncharacterized protein n=1 Tax=Opuntia streptacantha TaxID=393608 RepID=A0A7C9AD95_OPUST
MKVLFPAPPLPRAGLLYGCILFLGLHSLFTPFIGPSTHAKQTIQPAQGPKQATCYSFRHLGFFQTPKKTNKPSLTLRAKQYCVVIVQSHPYTFRTNPWKFGSFQFSHIIIID